MSQTRAQQLVAAYDRRMADAGNFWNLYQEATEFTNPVHSNVQKQLAPGSRQMNRVFDSTAIRARKLLAATMAGSLTPNALKWHALRMREDDLNDIKEVAEWLQECDDRLFMAFQQSNFEGSSTQFYGNAIIGTGALLIEEQPKLRSGQFGGFQFTALPLGRYVIDEAPNGLVDTLYRSYMSTAKAIVQRFGNDEDTVGREVLAAYEQRPEQTFEVIHGVYPRGLHDPSKAALDGTNRAYASCYTLRKGQPKFLYEGGYHEFPVCVARWDKEASEVYGRGPAVDALPDTRTLNRAIELMLRAAGKDIDPPWAGIDGAISDLDLTPGAYNTVEAIDGDVRKALMPLHSGISMDLTQFIVADQRAKVEQAFYWDQLQLNKDTLMTATEVERRWEVMRRILGPTLGRFRWEFMTPLINVCFATMLRANAFSAPPEELLQRSDGNIDVVFQGPLDSSQKFARVTGFNEWMNSGALIAQATGSTAHFDNANFDVAWTDQRDILGLPATYERDSEEVAQTREQRAQEQQAQQQQMTALNVTKAAKDGGAALKSVHEIGQNGTAQKVPA